MAFLLGAVYLIQGRYYAHISNTVLDEGAYLYKGFLFASGRYWPFLDYGPLTNHTPLSFLIPGIAQTVFGAGLRTGRYFTVALGLLMLLGLWIVTRRFGGRWWALFAVAAVALNPTLIQTYSIAATQGMVACMVVWTMVLTLGEGRPLWQISLGATLAGLTLMTRENLVPMLPLLLFYIFWQHGVKAGIWATLSGVVTVGIIHAIYWPNILSVWAGWIPEAVTPFLNPWRGYYWGRTPVWHPDMPFESRWLEAERLADDVAVVSHGKIIAQGTPHELRAVHVGERTTEYYGPPDRLAAIEQDAREAGLATRRTGPSIAVLGSETAPQDHLDRLGDGAHRPASLEDVFVLLTGEVLD